jgi:hypothetical protein
MCCLQVLRVLQIGFDVDAPVRSVGVRVVVGTALSCAVVPARGVLGEPIRYRVGVRRWSGGVDCADPVGRGTYRSCQILGVVSDAGREVGAAAGLFGGGGESGVSGG